MESPESILSWSVGYLKVEDEPRLAMLLEDCEPRVWQERDEQLALVDELRAEYFPLTAAVLTVAAELFAEVEQRRGRVGGVLMEAIGDLDDFYVEPGPAREWSNQGAGFDRTRALSVWQRMRFRSHSEVAIAKALVAANIDFVPNCLVRHGANADDRLNLQPDFLIFDGDKTGVFEVDGPPWHPPERAAEAHAHDRRFRSKGWVVERFDSEECRNFPDDVVAQFMRLMRSALPVPSHGGVEDHRDGQPDTELADRGRSAPGEDDEDGEHDRRRAGDHPGGLLQPELDRGGVVIWAGGTVRGSGRRLANST